MKKKIIIIDGKRIYLRTLTVKDATERYCSWINDQEVNRFLDSKRITIDELKKYIQKRVSDSNCIFCGIFLKENNFHIGNVKLEPINFIEKKATLGIIIGAKNYWNKGFATESLEIILNYSFNTLGLDEIDLGVYKKNKSAIKAYIKTGFEISEENVKTLKMKIKRKKIINN